MEKVQRSCAVKNSCQLTRMFTFALKGAADRGEGVGKRKNLTRDQQIGILRADRMPVHALSGNRNFRHQIRSTNGDTFSGGATQRNPADDPVFCRNLLFTEELTELLGLGIARN